MPKYKIKISSDARKDIKKLEKPELKKLDKAIMMLSNTPFQPQTKKLTDFPYGEYRYRIGDHRIIFDIYSDTILILRIQHRKEVYKK